MGTSHGVVASQRPHPSTPVQSDPNITGVEMREGPLVIKTDEAQLEEIFGERAGAVQKSVESLETLTIEIGTHSHLLDKKQYQVWKSYILSGAKQLNQAVLEKNAQSFELKLQSMKKHLEGLKAFFKYETEQGLVAVHSESGVRIYRNVVNGKPETWLVTPDKKSFSDADANRIKDFVQGVTGVRLEHNAIFQKEKQKDGTMLLSCRIDKLDLESSKNKNYEYHLSTQTRTGETFTEDGVKNIRFTKEQIESGGIIVDTTRGFGHDDEWPVIVVQIFPFGYDLKDLNLPSEAFRQTPESFSSKRGSSTAPVSVTKTVVDAIETRLTTPVKPTRMNFSKSPQAFGTGAIAQFFSKHPRWAGFMRRTGLGMRLFPQTFGLGGPHGPIQGPPAPPAPGRIVTFFNKHPRWKSFMQKTGLGRRLLPKVFGAGYPHGPHGPVPPPTPSKIAAYFDARPRLKTFMQKTTLGRRIFPKTFGEGGPHASPAPTSPGRIDAFFSRHPKIAGFLRRTRMGNLLMPKTFAPGTAHGIPMKSAAPAPPATPAPAATPVQPSNGRVARYLQNRPRLTRFLAKMHAQKVMPRTFAPGGAVAANLPAGSPGSPYHGPAKPSKWQSFKAKHPAIAQASGRVNRVATSNGARATYYTAALVGIHNFCSGRYEDDVEHSYLPSLLRGGLTEKTLKGWGVDTEFQTKDIGAFPAWGVNVATAGGDIGLIYGGGKLTQVGLAGLGKVPVVRLLPFSSASKGVGLGMKGLGKVAGVVYAPYAGYSYFRNGQFINEGESGTYKRVGGTIGEGFAAGFMVGGPWGGVAGAVLSTGGAFIGAMGALDDVVEDGKLQDRNVGVKMTLKRGAEGWLLPENAPDNHVPSEARDYIDKVARTQFIQEAIKIKNRYGVGDDVPFSSGNWGENYGEFDDFIHELKRYRDGKYTYVGVKKFGIDFEVATWYPLEDVPSGAKQKLLAKYNEIFVHSKGTKRQLLRLYERSWQATSYSGIKKPGSSEWEQNNLDGWDTFWGKDKGCAFKAVVTDSMTAFTKDYHNQGFAAEEQKLRAQLKSGEIDHSHPSVQDLVKREMEYLHKKFPNLAGIVSTEKGQSQMGYFTRTEKGDVLNLEGEKTNESEIMNSFALEMIAGPSPFRLNQIALEYGEKGFAKKEADIRAKLKSGELHLQSPEVQSLIEEQTSFLQSKVPNFFALIASEKGQRRMNNFTRLDRSFSSKSIVMSSLAIEAHFGKQKELKAFMEQTKDPAFQKRVLSGLEGQEREDLRLHFANKKLLDAKRYGDLVEKSAKKLVERLDREHGVSPLPSAVSPSDVGAPEPAPKFNPAEVSNSDLMQTQQLKDVIFLHITKDEQEILTEFWKSNASSRREEALSIIEAAMDKIEAAEQKKQVSSLIVPTQGMGLEHGRSLEGLNLPSVASIS